MRMHLLSAPSASRRFTCVLHPWMLRTLPPPDPHAWHCPRPSRLALPTTLPLLPAASSSAAVASTTLHLRRQRLTRNLPQVLLGRRGGPCAFALRRGADRALRDGHLRLLPRAAAAAGRRAHGAHRVPAGTRLSPALLSPSVPCSTAAAPRASLPSCRWRWRPTKASASACPARRCAARWRGCKPRCRAARAAAAAARAAAWMPTAATAAPRAAAGARAAVRTRRSCSGWRARRGWAAGCARRSSRRRRAS